jgi:O-antigen ligase
LAAHATPRPAEEIETRTVARLAVAAAAVGVFLTWTSDEPVQLDGMQGPNNGLLVLIVAALALAWTGSLARGSWIGVVGVLGASVVMGWTAVENWFDNRDVFGAATSPGPVLVLAASVILAGTVVVRAVELGRRY